MATTPETPAPSEADKKAVLRALVIRPYNGETFQTLQSMDNAPANLTAVLKALGKEGLIELTGTYTYIITNEGREFLGIQNYRTAIGTRYDDERVAYR